MRLRRIIWKKEVVIAQVRDAEDMLRQGLLECNPFTYPKIDASDIWITYPRYAK